MKLNDFSNEMPHHHKSKGRASRSTGIRPTISTRKSFGTPSPLRYPGGKAALAGLIADLIRMLDIPDCTYVEPYAGGAGAALALLQNGIVQRLVINDIDPAVYAFWDAAVNRNEAFMDWVSTVPLTLEEWEVQRHTYRTTKTPSDSLGRAFFYLNRTNRSGIANAGVIGGKSQTGRYKIDARFNRDTLIERLAKIGEMRDVIEVTSLDGRTAIDNHKHNPSVFMYIDPPYVAAGSRLYLNSFSATDHTRLADTVREIQSAKWLMTYDASPFIERLYAWCYIAALEITYSARHPGKARELIIVSREIEKVIKNSDFVNSR